VSVGSLNYNIKGKSAEQLYCPQKAIWKTKDFIILTLSVNPGFVHRQQFSSESSLEKGIGLIMPNVKM